MIGPCGPNFSPVGLCPTCVPPCRPGGTVRWPDRGVTIGLLGIAVRWGGVIGRTRVAAVWGCLTGRFGMAVRFGDVGRVTLRWGAVSRVTLRWGGGGRVTVRCGVAGRDTLCWGGGGDGRAIARGAGGGDRTAGAATRGAGGAGRAAGAADAPGLFCCWACATVMNAKDTAAVSMTRAVTLVSHMPADLTRRAGLSNMAF